MPTISPADHLPRWRPLRYRCAEHAEFGEQRTDDASDGGILHQNEA